MKVLAILDVDEEKLKETGHNFAEEVAHIVQPSASIVKNVEVREPEECEYVAFVWNVKSNEYEQIGRPVMTELLCRHRFNEYVENGWLSGHYQTDKVIFKRRNTFVFKDCWEEIQEKGYYLIHSPLGYGYVVSKVKPLIMK